MRPPQIRPKGCAVAPPACRVAEEGRGMPATGGSAGAGGVTRGRAGGRAGKRAGGRAGGRRGAWPLGRAT